MKVHFITSRLSLMDDMESLRLIVSTLEKVGYTMDENWIETAHNRERNPQPETQADWSNIFKMNIESIARADVVIAETTQASFAIGYQVAVAVQQKKPVLLLRHSEADKNAFITGVEDGWVQHEGYTEANLEAILRAFYEANDIKSKDMRFNFFIDRKIYNYLRFAAYKTGKTKAEILRDLVQNEIDKQ